MKILKKAIQKNVVVDKERYTVAEIAQMLSANEIFYFVKGGNISYEPLNSWEIEDADFRIFTDNLTEIKVVLDDGYYTVVANGKNGKTYYVSI